MQSKAKDVTTYIEEAPAERREALTRLRDLCRAILLDFEETMEYGGPSYRRNGEVEVGFASQTPHAEESNVRAIDFWWSAFHTGDRRDSN